MNAIRNTVRNSADFDQALTSGNLEDLKQALNFLEQLEAIRKNEGSIFKKNLAQKKLKVLQTVLEISQENIIAFFGKSETILKDISSLEKELG
jgi:hypothetical protein